MLRDVDRISVVLEDAVEIRTTRSKPSERIMSRLVIVRRVGSSCARVSLRFWTNFERDLCAHLSQKCLK